MNLALFLTGLLLLILSILDILYTVFSSRGSGYITGFTTKMIWIFFVFVNKRLHIPQFLRFAGLLIICLTLLQWVVLIWGANVLIVSSSDFSIINTQTKAPAGLIEKIYVVGYTITTMGNGDYTGGSPIWDVYLSVTALTGIASITIALTYLVQVLSGVTSKRAFSSSVFGIGSDPVLLVSNAWNGKDLSSMNHYLLHLGNEITMLAAKHLAYPILFYYYVESRSKSLPVALTVLDEAMTIIYLHIPKQQWPDHLILQSTRYAVTSFIDTLKNNFIKPAKSAPPVPELNLLKEENITVTEGNQYKQRYETFSERRKVLLAFLQNEGRDWETVYQKEYHKDV